MVLRSRLSAAAVVSLLVCAVLVMAQEPEPGSFYPALKVGSTGEFKKGQKATVVKVIAINAALVRIDKGKDFVLSEIPTKDVADDDLIEMKGKHKVTGTFKYRDRTYKLVVKEKE